MHYCSVSLPSSRANPPKSDSELHNSQTGVKWTGDGDSERAIEGPKGVLLSRLCRESNGQSPFSKSDGGSRLIPLARRSVGGAVGQSVGGRIAEHFSYSRHARAHSGAVPHRMPLTLQRTIPNDVTTAAVATSIAAAEAAAARIIIWVKMWTNFRIIPIGFLSTKTT